MQYSIVNYSQIDKSLFRLEAEFYNSNSLLNIYCFSGEEIIDFVQYGTSKELNEEKRGFPTLRLNEFDSFFIKSPQKYCDKIDADTFQSLALKKGDVLICRTNGNPKLVGKSAVVPEDSNYAFASYLFRIRPKEETLLPTTLVTYLNSSVGRSEIEKHLMVSNQANFSPAKFREILIPQFGAGIQSSIDKSIWKSFSKHSKSKQVYTQAQTLLLSELGLTGWQPKHRLTFVKNYSDTEQVERIGADYFQPFYEEVNDKLQTTGFVFVKDICSQINYGTVPTSPYSEDNSGVPYIKGLNLKNLRVDTEKLDYITNTDDLPNKVFTKEGDIIISQMGTVGNCGVVSQEQENWAFASFTIRIRIADTSKYDPYFVALYIEHIAKPYYLMRNIAQASVRQNTDLPTIKQMPIPNLSFEKQQQISQKITESFNLQKQSKHLLECAKRAVEIAIEQDEQTAIDWLEQRTTTINISDYIPVFEKLDELGCSYSEGIAILPVDFEAATSSTTTRQLMGTLAIQKLFRISNLPYSEIRRGNEKPSYIGYRASEWVIPTLFFSASLLSENPTIISVSLGVIANYLTDFLKESGGKKNGRLDIVVEKNKSKICKKISYEGPVDGIKELADIAKEVLNE